MPAPITISTRVNASPEKTWLSFTEPSHITQWCQASDEWHAPYADNDLRPGGNFKTTMAAKDGSFSFDFGGTYDAVTPHELIAYTLGDGRKVEVRFKEVEPGITEVMEKFDPEVQNSEEMQRTGWQAILDSFKKYTEGI